MRPVLSGRNFSLQFNGIDTNHRHLIISQPSQDKIWNAESIVEENKFPLVSGIMVKTKRTWGSYFPTSFACKDTIFLW